MNSALMLVAAVLVQAQVPAPPAPAASSHASPPAPPEASSLTSPALPDGRRRVLVLDLKANGVDADVVRTLSDIVASAVTLERSLAVTSGADVRSLIAVQSDRQSVGCDDSNDGCLADLAGALGADLVVSGSVGRLGDLLVVSVAFYDAAQQAAVGREQVEATNIASLSPLVEDAVARLLGRPVPVREEAPSALVPVGAIVGGVGVVAGVIGVSVAAWSISVQGDPASVGAVKEQAEGALTPFIIVGGAGAAAVVAGALVAAVGMVEP